MQPTHYFDLLPVDQLINKYQINDTSNIPRYHVILLNQPIPPYTEELLKYAQSILCADGAANHLYTKHFCAAEQSWRWPTVICGDLDSIKPNVLKAYRSAGINIKHDADQNSTDTHKCWMQLASSLQAGDIIFIVGGVGGRLDHTISNLSFIYKLQNESKWWMNGNTSSFNNCQVYILGEKMLCFLLPPGTSKIRFPSKYISSICGLLPLGTPCRVVNTYGLRWNLKRHRIQLNGLISTSNEIMDTDVQIDTTDPLIWYSQTGE